MYTKYSDRWSIFRLYRGGFITDESLEEIKSNIGDKAMCLIIDDASLYKNQIDLLRKSVSQKGIPLLLLTAERSNLWPYKDGQIFELETLNDSEIDNLICKLEEFGMLGVLENEPARY